MSEVFSVVFGVALLPLGAPLGFPGFATSKLIGGLLNASLGRCHTPLVEGEHGVEEVQVDAHRLPCELLGGLLTPPSSLDQFLRSPLGALCVRAEVIDDGVEEVLRQLPASAGY